MRSLADQRVAADEWIYPDELPGSCDEWIPATQNATRTKVGPASNSLAALDYGEFAAMLKGALRNFSRSDLLARSPLLRSRLLATGASAADLQPLLPRTPPA